MLLKKLFKIENIENLNNLEIDEEINRLYLHN